MYLLIHVFFYIQNHRCSDCIDERVEISLLFDFDVAGLYMMKAYVVSSCSLFLDKYLLLPLCEARLMFGAWLLLMWTCGVQGIRLIY
jgi:hypothetical protein